MSELDDYKLAKELFSYDPETGILKRTAPIMRSNGAGITSRGVGEPAGWLDGDGYLRVRMPKMRQIPVHRIAWLMQTGKWPKEQIDHINGVRTDNRWINLRDVSCAVNSQNRHRKCGRSRDLPIGITEMFRNGRRFFRVSCQRNGVKMQNNFACIQTAVLMLEKFKRDLLNQNTAPSPISALAADY
jgi:hypothetical protein